MRKHLIWVLGAAMAAVAVIGVGAASAVPNVQSITGTISPSKLPKTGAGKAVSLFTDVSSTNSGNANQVPNPTTLAKVDFDKDIKIQQKGLPTCNSSQFTASTTTAQAQSACGSSKLGGGTGQIEIPTTTGAPPIKTTATITAFNGKAKKLILFNYTTLAGAQVLTGTLGPSTGGSKYGTTLTVPVPPLAGGSAVIQEFNTKVKKTYHFKGKKLSYVTSTCKDKKLNFQARFTDNVGQTATGTFTQKCKQS